MLKRCYQSKCLEAGTDEAGRGCLAGPVFAAAVILPPGFSHPLLNDSKQLSESQRNHLRTVVEQEALSYAVASVSESDIDRINILKASIRAMHLAIHRLNPSPELIVVDGNRFYPFPGIAHQCFIKGDARFMNIAAASILAKTWRDEYMLQKHEEYPQYDWASNKGYGTAAHVEAIRKHGPCPLHRKSFVVKSLHQLNLF